MQPPKQLINYDSTLSIWDVRFLVTDLHCGFLVDKFCENGEIWYIGIPKYRNSTFWEEQI